MDADDLPNSHLDLVAKVAPTNLAWLKELLSKESPTPADVDTDAQKLVRRIANCVYDIVFFQREAEHTRRLRELAKKAQKQATALTQTLSELQDVDGELVDCMPGRNPGDLLRLDLVVRKFTPILVALQEACATSSNAPKKPLPRVLFRESCEVWRRHKGTLPPDNHVNTTPSPFFECVVAIAEDMAPGNPVASLLTPAAYKDALKLAGN